jgi:dienelactone hydrolase
MSFSPSLERLTSYPIFVSLVKKQVSTNLLREDVDRPLLVLMGDADKEAPPADCLPTLHILKERGAPVEWYVYPGATHAWDRYSKEATEDSGRRIFDFMERHLGK